MDAQIDDDPVPWVISWGAAWDWITPVWAGATGAAGATASLVLSVDCGYSGQEIAVYLLRHGVLVLGLYRVNAVFMLSVPQDQVDHARRLLAAAGVAEDGDG
jgi:hypothetical protein